jgi:hypothetical protein
MLNIREQADGALYAAVLVNGGASLLDLVFMGEGFTEDQQDDFAAKVDQAVAALALTAPISEVMDAFNIWRIDTISEESGVYKPAVHNTPKDTFFEMRMLNHFIHVPPSGQQLILDVQELAPDCDNVVVLVNDSERAGIAIMGNVAIATSGHPTSNRTVVHELGHAIGQLSDEYECYKCDGTDSGRSWPGYEPDDLNLTASLAVDGGKWGAMILPGTPVPTTNPPANATTVGLWEGGGYYATGIYRPTQMCCMRMSTFPFCPVCAWHLKSAIESYILILWMPSLPVFELIERIPERISVLRWPLPVCLSCPSWSRERATLALSGIRGGRLQDLRILGSDGRVVDAARRSPRNATLEFAFDAVAGEPLFLEMSHEGDTSVSFQARFEIGGTQVPLDGVTA